MKNKTIALLIDSLYLVITLLPGLLFLYQTADLIKKSANVWTASKGVFHHFDFVSFYACGAMMLQQLRDTGCADIYNTAAQLQAYNAAVSPASVPYTNFLQHVPYVFCFLPVLALAPLRLSYLIWIGLSILFAFAGAYFLRLCRDQSKLLDTMILGLLMLSSLPGNFCLIDGQISWFYFFVLALFCWSLHRDRPIIIGLSLAAVSIKPQYFLFLVVPLFARQMKKAFLICITALVLLTALAGFMLGWQNIIHYPQILLHGESTEHFALEKPKTMISLRGLLSILLSNKAALLSCFAFEVIALALTARLWLAKNISQNTKLIISLTAMLVLSAHFYLYEGVLMAAPAMLALPSWRPTVCLSQGNRANWLYVLLLAFPLVNLLILLAAPSVGTLILPAPLLAATEDNGRAGGLCVYVGLFLYNLTIMVAALYALPPLQRHSVTSDAVSAP